MIWCWKWQLPPGARYIITFNKRDFVEAVKFGIEVVTPREFLNTLD